MNSKERQVLYLNLDKFIYFSGDFYGYDQVS